MDLGPSRSFVSLDTAHLDVASLPAASVPHECPCVEFVFAQRKPGRRQGQEMIHQRTSNEVNLEGTNDYTLSLVLPVQVLSP